MEYNTFYDLVLTHHTDPDFADNYVLERVFYGENEDPISGGT